MKPIMGLVVYFLEPEKPDSLFSFNFIKKKDLF